MSRWKVIPSKAPGETHRLHLLQDKDIEGNPVLSQSKRSEAYRRAPFFALSSQSSKEVDTSETTEQDNGTSDAVATAPPKAVETEESAVATPAARATLQDLSPEQQAAALRLQAEKARLEAERMDAELTLQKIARLEKEITAAKKQRDKMKETDDITDSSLEDLQREMDVLQSKIRGEAPSKTASLSGRSSPSGRGPRSSAGTNSTQDISMTIDLKASLGKALDNDNLQEIQRKIETMPGIVMKMLAVSVELDFSKASDINSTELALRLNQVRNFDFSYSKKPKPVFTEQQIEESVKAIEKMDNKELKPLVDLSVTEQAKAMLEMEYYIYDEGAFEDEVITKVIQGEDWLKPVFEEFNKTGVDAAIEARYPKCTRKEGLEPTQKDVDRLFTDILPKANFVPSAKPEKVAGGYIIRGKTKPASGSEATDGDALIGVIDEELARSSLKDKLTVCYTTDFAYLAQQLDNLGTMEELADLNLGGMDIEVNTVDVPVPEDLDPILYVLGPDICREPKPVQLSLVTALGIGSSWYLAIYPFLLNSGIAQRVEDQLALADAGMTPDLTFLTELSFPLFATFLLIQLVHEVGHRVVAVVNGFEITFPTFVPSIITGMTSSVTTFKKPPKNRNAMFDFAVAGPLAGILASIVAIAVGSQLTLSAEAATLPALPLEILRQSTLGGAIIDNILGSGALYVSESALGTPAVANMMVQLHPVAIAGYIGLVVNALGLLPIGTTDGGRMSMALFGRESKLAIGGIFLFALLVIGFFGSDLFLFYFAFCVALQSGNEIPARNEVDKLSFSRVIVATAVYVLGILSIIPFQ